MHQIGQKIQRHGTSVYLVNTGWTGGGYGEGQRMKLSYTRAMVTAALQGDLAAAPCDRDPIFGLMVPRECPGVPSEILNPRNTWKDKAKFDSKARELADRFARNSEKYRK